ncbi:hypothetical protein M427DRAFT_54302 [Gonapodya prolifera JEL478]|uniref:Uncharacterized protein n=1 Tax=Gonapodya prolifera (strain JEL478) TaxID=1344416 RepID=A0A139AMB4_GONPJ|nr:hypothetical protein M427DRAFT_54302 [Gonapodya prolifera JEL478]|eukprot:KXS17704.1 hypothetical protein M427DRAFT_54302 [Gonapodya prolifera JEL478]
MLAAHPATSPSPFNVFPPEVWRSILGMFDGDTIFNKMPFVCRDAYRMVSALNNPIPVAYGIFLDVSLPFALPATDRVADDTDPAKGLNIMHVGMDVSPKKVFHIFDGGDDGDFRHPKVGGGKLITSIVISMHGLAHALKNNILEQCIKSFLVRKSGRKDLVPVCGSIAGRDFLYDGTAWSAMRLLEIPKVFFINGLPYPCKREKDETVTEDASVDTDVGFNLEPFPSVTKVTLFALSSMCFMSEFTKRDVLHLFPNVIELAVQMRVFKQPAMILMIVNSKSALEEAEEFRVSDVMGLADLKHLRTLNVDFVANRHPIDHTLVPLTLETLMAPTVRLDALARFPNMKKCYYITSSSEEEWDAVGRHEALKFAWFWYGPDRTHLPITTRRITSALPSLTSLRIVVALVEEGDSPRPTSTSRNWPWWKKRLTVLQKCLSRRGMKGCGKI